MHAQPCFCPVCVPERTAGARILVCGGRHFDNWVAVSRAMDYLDQRRPIGLLIHGDAPGADRTAAQRAKLEELGGAHFLRQQIDAAKPKPKPDS